MTRILFVDDESSVLDGLRNSLRSMRREWEMRFALGGSEALAVLSADPVDVVVSDMRMPGMDGEQLLRKVRERYPQVIRIVLSGQAEGASTHRVASIAHQFLSKPCGREDLCGAIGRVVRYREFVENEAVASLVAGIDSLPSVPQVYADLVEALANDNLSSHQIARIVERDPALSAKILQLVNSAFFGLGTITADVERAVNYLGLEIIKSLAISVEVCRAFSGSSSPAGFSIDAFQSHALAAARVAAAMVKRRLAVPQATTAALLHDIGILVMMIGMPQEMDAVLRSAKGEPRAHHRLERELVGVSHAEVGAYLLGLWGLPFAVIEPIAYHHEPSKVSGEARAETTALRLADHFAHAMLGDLGPGATSSMDADLAEALAARAELRDLIEGTCCIELSEPAEGQLLREAS